MRKINPKITALLPIFSLLLSLLFISAPYLTKTSFAETDTASKSLDGHAIAKLSNERYIAHDESTELWMLLINNQGETHIRRLLRYRKSFPDHKEVILKFLLPEDIRNTGFLNQERPKEKYDTQFLYLPAVLKVRRISSANKDRRWVGSDFFYEDIQELKLGEWNYKRLEDSPFDDFPCYVVEWLPKADTDTVYGREIYWYRKEGYLPVKVEYYNKKGKLWKMAEFRDLRYSQSVWMAWKIKMEDFDEKHITEMYRRWAFFDTQLPDDYFTTRNLEKNISGYSYPSGLWDIINADSPYDSKIKTR